MPPRKDLGSILVDENAIGQKDLERVERDRKESGRPLWRLLIEHGLSTEDELFFVLAQRFGAPVLAEEVIAEAKMPAAENLRRALPREQAIAGGILPIDYSTDGRRVTVVMVDPSDEHTLAAFLTRAQVPEGRALLGRRAAIERAIDRCYGAAGKVASIESTRAPAPPPKDPTATIKLDPELQAEISRLGPQASVEPPPRQAVRRPRKPTPRAVPTDEAPASQPAASLEEERFARALLQAVEALARELELRLLGEDDPAGRLGRVGTASEMARLSRRVARQLGVGRRAAEEIGVTAQLYGIDRLMHRVDGTAADELFGELGWAAAGDGGMVPILRALTAASAGFRGAAAGTPPLGARIISVVADYLELGAAAGEPSAATDLGTVSQLLRASSAGATVVDALLRVLESERADIIPAMPLKKTPQE